jgi:hypothetical protein
LATWSFCGICFGDIVLRPWVAAELGGHQIEIEPNWMRVVAAQDRVRFAELRRQLDPGALRGLTPSGRK